jgi:hypothetical protein
MSVRPKKRSDIAGQFRELQRLRKQVHEAELDLSRNRSSDAADTRPKGDNKDLGPRNDGRPTTPSRASPARWRV